jgi:CheY-like chemotaxis protein
MPLAVVTVLYVEDEHLLRITTAEELEDAGLKVVIAESGIAAFLLLNSSIGLFQALITDVNLGHGPDGWEVARVARELNRGMHVIYASGASMSEWELNGVTDSVMIKKPFTAAQIMDAVFSFVSKTGTAMPKDLELPSIS